MHKIDKCCGECGHGCFELGTLLRMAILRAQERGLLFTAHFLILALIESEGKHKKPPIKNI